MFPALKSAYRELAPLDARLKHIVLLSDGVSLSRLKRNETILIKLKRASITVSTVAMGSEADVDTMAEIARRTGGRFWFVENPQELPRIFAEETRRSSEEALVEEPLAAFRVKSLAELGNLNPERSRWKPTVRARTRATSETLWQVDVPEAYAEGVARRPLLARARVGRGRALALAGPISSSALGSMALMRGFVAAVLTEQRGVPLEVVHAELGPEIALDIRRTGLGALEPGYQLEIISDNDGSYTTRRVPFSMVAANRARARLPRGSQSHLGRVIDPRGVATAWVTIPGDRRESLPRPAGQRVSEIAGVTGGEIVEPGSEPAWLADGAATRTLRSGLGLLALALVTASVWIRRPASPGIETESPG